MVVVVVSFFCSLRSASVAVSADLGIYEASRMYYRALTQHHVARRHRDRHGEMVDDAAEIENATSTSTLDREDNPAKR